MTISIHHSVRLNQDYAKVSSAVSTNQEKDNVNHPLLTIIMTLSTHLLSNSGTYQDYAKYPSLLTTMMTSSMHLLGTTNTPVTNMQYAVLGVHPASSAVSVAHYFVSLVATIHRRFWIRHARTLKIFAIARSILFKMSAADVCSIHKRRMRASSTTGNKGT